MKNFKKNLEITKVLSHDTILEMAEAILNNKDLSDRAVFEITALNGDIVDKDKKPDFSEEELWDLCGSYFDLEDKLFRFLATEAERKDRMYRRTKKNTNRDKSRHGWKKGSRHEGWGKGVYELYTFPEKKARDQEKDKQFQIADLNVIDESRTTAWTRVSALLHEEKNSLIETLNILKVNKDLESVLSAVGRLDQNCQEWWTTTVTKKIYGILDEFPLCEGEKKELVNRATNSFFYFLSKRIADTRREMIRKKIIEDIHIAEYYNVDIDDLF